MTINIQELLDKGYKEFPPTKFDTADRRFQKRFRAENGNTLYFINVDMYYSWGTIPENFEVEVQLYQQGTHEPVNLRFFCGWTLESAEDVEAPDYYMEVDCPDKDNMNARFETDGKIINKLFPYSYTGFIDACDWFDEQRATYRFAKLIGGK